MNIKQRSIAIADGDKKYFTGHPCIHGHNSPRYTLSGICCACNAANAKKSAKIKVRKYVAKLQAHFMYPLHPDDHAAAMNYCHALNLQRGRMPHIEMDPVLPPADEAALDAKIAAHRAHIIGSAVPKVEPHLPREFLLTNP